MSVTDEADEDEDVEMTDALRDSCASCCVLEAAGVLTGDIDEVETVMHGRVVIAAGDANRGGASAKVACSSGGHWRGDEGGSDDTDVYHGGRRQLKAHACPQSILNLGASLRPRLTSGLDRGAEDHLISHRHVATKHLPPLP